MSFEPILLAPEEEAVEVYPYRRVWRTAWLEVAALVIVVAGVVVLTQFTNTLPTNYNATWAKTAVALVPFGAWLLFSYRGERRAVQPREGLLGVLVLGALVANAIAIPLEEGLFVPERWMVRSGFFSRVLSYTFTIGFTAEFLKYAVLRYTVWPARFEQRLDGVAYALAVAVGYATVYNLHVALYTEATLSAAALRIASHTFLHMALAPITGYFLAELRIGRPPVFWIPAGLFLTALLSGLYYAFRALALVSGLGIAATASAPLRGLALAVAAVSAALVIMAFLIESADTRMEALTGRRQTI